MGWTKTTTREKRHRCRLPRIKRRHGDGSAWQCDTCSNAWKIHRGGCCTHWNRHGDFCDHCGPTRPYRILGHWYGGTMSAPPGREPQPIESPAQPEPVNTSNVTDQ